MKTMKAYSIIALSIFLSIVLMSGCKKDDAPKDYAEAISNKTWSGSITYTGDSIQYYTVYFNPDKSLLWSQYSGDYPGNWVLSGKQVSMSFVGNNAIIKADITDDDKFSNITVENTNAYKVNSGALVASPAMGLESTTWDGTGFSGFSQYPYQMNFLPGGIVRLKLNNTLYPSYPYTRSASGAAIRFNTFLGPKVFAVIMSDNEIKGCMGGSVYPWRTIKQ
jgi:hypothetical protein